MLHKKKRKEETVAVQPASVTPQETRAPFKPELSRWIINIDKKVLAGKIREIRKDGTILWEDSTKTLIESKTVTFSNEGYQCADLEPEMLHWRIL